MPQTALIPFLAFPLFWCGVIYLVGKLGGWNKLAQYFPAQTIGGSFFAEVNFGSLKINGLTNYNNALTIKVGDMGIYMVPFFLFRCGHDPVFIPWSAVINHEEKKYWLLTTLTLQLQNKTTLMFSGKAAKSINDYLQRFRKKY